jgi:hypothetical protein
MSWFTIWPLSFSFLFWTTSHDVQLSQFDLSQSGTALVLNIKVEQIDLFRSLKDFESMTSTQKKAEINDYLQHKTSWSINSTSFSICDYTYTIKAGHFFIQGYLENVPKKIKQIRFVNEFLTEEIAGHLNIIHFNLGPQLRSFKMDENRQEITVAFN